MTDEYQNRREELEKKLTDILQNRIKQCSRHLYWTAYESIAEGVAFGISMLGLYDHNDFMLSTGCLLYMASRMLNNIERVKGSFLDRTYVESISETKRLLESSSEVSENEI